MPPMSRSLSVLNEQHDWFDQMPCAWLVLVSSARFQHDNNLSRSPPDRSCGPYGDTSPAAAPRFPFPKSVQRRA